MANGDNLKDLLNSGNTLELRSIRDAELQTLVTNKIILDIVKSATKKKLEGSTQNILRSLKILSVKDYIKLEKDHTLLGLNNLQIDLSYTERKALKKFVNEEVKKQIAPQIEFINNKRKEYSDILTPQKLQMEIIVIEEKRRQNMLQLIELKNKKLCMLKNILEIKLGPYLQNELKLMDTQYKCNQQKTVLLQQYIAQEFVCGSNYTDKAIKEVVRYMDAELED